MFGSWFAGGASSTYDREYYERLQQERLMLRQKEAAELAAIDAEADPVKKLELRRARYRCGDRFTQAESIATLPTLVAKLAALPNNTTVAAAAASSGRGYYAMANDTVTLTPFDTKCRKPVNEALAAKISIFKGDITALEVDAIVNAANSSLLGGGGIDGAIHSAAGPGLVEECRPLNGCPTGSTKITKGCRLPAKFVLHTVGPIGHGDSLLRGCYRSCLDLAKEHRLRTVAFCCVSTGIFSFPLVRATHIALSETRRWLEDIEAASAAEGATAAEPADPAAPAPFTLADIDRIIFCVFKPTELECYERIAPAYFPTATFPIEALAGDEEADPFQLEDGSQDDASDESEGDYGTAAGGYQQQYPPRYGGGGGGGAYSGYGGAAGGSGRGYAGGGYEGGSVGGYGGGRQRDFS